MDRPSPEGWPEVSGETVPDPFAGGPSPTDEELARWAALPKMHAGVPDDDAQGGLRMRAVFDWFRRAAGLLWAVIVFTIISFPFLLYGLLIAGLSGIALLTFLWVRSHPETATPIVVGVAALMCLSLLCSPGVIRADRNGDSVYYRLRCALGGYQLKLRMRSDSRQNDRKASRLKRARRKVLAALSSDGPAPVDAIATRLNLPTATVAEYLSHAVWRGWVAEEATEGDGTVHYSLTGRGVRELDAPGSTDQELL